MTDPFSVPRLPQAWHSASGLSDRPTAFYNALLTEHFVLLTRIPIEWRRF